MLSGDNRTVLVEFVVGGSCGGNCLSSLPNVAAMVEAVAVVVLADAVTEALSFESSSLKCGS